MTKLNNEQAARALSLDQSITVEITRFKEVVRRHAKYDFLGYLGIRIVGKPNTPVAGLNLFMNLEAKVLPNGFYLDMPTEKGKDGNFYSDACFGSAETRAVVTLKVFQSEAVQTAIRNCAALPKPGAEQTQVAAPTGSNPYAS